MKMSVQEVTFLEQELCCCSYWGTLIMIMVIIVILIIMLIMVIMPMIKMMTMLIIKQGLLLLLLLLGDCRGQEPFYYQVTSSFINRHHEREQVTGFMRRKVMIARIIQKKAYDCQDHNFSYSVEDNSSGNQFGHSETRSDKKLKDQVNLFSETRSKDIFAQRRGLKLCKFILKIFTFAYIGNFLLLMPCCC